MLFVTVLRFESYELVRILPNVDLIPTPNGRTVLSISSNDHLSEDDAEEVEPIDCFFRSINDPFLNPNSSSHAFASGLSISMLVNVFYPLNL